MQPLFGHFVVTIQRHFVVTFPAFNKVAYFRNVATEIVVAYTQRSFLATFLEKVPVVPIQISQIVASVLLKLF